MTNLITIKAIIKVPIEKAWNYWNQPQHILNWNTASPDWHTVSAEVDLLVGGKFSSRMEAKDGSFGFDFYGFYDDIILHKSIKITLGDNRKMNVDFVEVTNGVQITETFEPETENTIELQQQGWQAILDNFKNYTETH